MTGQNSLNIDLTPFVLGGTPVYQSGTIAQNAGRTAVLEQYTVMAKIASSGKWNPLTDIDATDGSAFPRAIYTGPDIAAADLVAGDVAVTDLLIGGAACEVDKNKVVLENSLTLASAVIINTTAPQTFGTVEDCLRGLGIFMGDVDNVDGYENS